MDLFQGLGGTPDPWIGTDNLHPNDTGYQKVAELFFGLIRVQFEVSPVLTLTAAPRFQCARKPSVSGLTVRELLLAPAERQPGRRPPSDRMLRR
jgi:hypothetical protein